MTINLTDEQSEALKQIKSFLKDNTKSIFILRGSAGTGKTTLIAKLISNLEEMKMSCALLAPTGRATRILGNKIGLITGKREYAGSTIHGMIYTLSDIEVDEEAESETNPGIRMIFPLKNQEPGVSLLVIDEASMVGDKEVRGDFMQFGTGRLLRDLVTYARVRPSEHPHGHLTKLLFVGDPAQLPPVGENSSPALDDHYLQTEYKLHVSSFDLKQVMRQAKDSAILDVATELRDALLANRFNAFSLKPNQQDIEQLESIQSIERVVQDLKLNHSNVVVVYSNAAALEYNQSIRERRWGDVNLPIQVGDTLLVNKNSTIYFLSNGDLLKVVEASKLPEYVPVYIKGIQDQVKLRFRDVTVAFRDVQGEIIKKTCKILENLLDSPHRELSALEQRALLVEFRKRHPKLHPKSKEFKQIICNDPYFNALQVKYGYAMTCHKAQGGEWDTVIVDFNTQRGVRNAGFFRWAYTAITRSVKKLVIVNPPNFTSISTIAWTGNTEVASTATTINQQDLTLDPDWQRFSFTASILPLMQTHQQLRGVWAMQGIEIEQLQHLQYCERYTLVRHGKRTTVQYYYNGKLQIGRIGEVSSNLSDSALTEDALGALRALSSKSQLPQENLFIQEFLEGLDQAIAETGIRRTAYKSMPYRLRVSFADIDRNGEIDFTYDGKQSWTAAQEVGGVGATHQLYQDIQRLMQVSGRGTL